MNLYFILGVFVLVMVLAVIAWFIPDPPSAIDRGPENHSAG